MTWNSIIYPKGDTIPKIFQEQYAKYGNRKIAIRKKRYGIWQEYSWEESYLNAKYLALGMMSLGFMKGDKACILGDNDPEYLWADIAVQALGGVVVGLYIDAIPEEIKYIINHSDSKIIFAKDQEQVDKILVIKEELPNLKYIIYWEPKGLWFYEDSNLLKFNDVLEMGKKFEKGKGDLFEKEIDKGEADDLCIISYTSGTTGLPKGVMISHACLIMSCRDRMFAVDPWTDKDEYLSYVSPAWVTEHGFWAMALLAGVSINFPESAQTLHDNIREIGPSVIVYPTRMWESIMSSHAARMADSTWLKRWCWKILFPIGYRYAENEEKRIKSGIFLKVLYKIAIYLLFNQVKDKMGFSKLRSAWTGGAPLSPACFGYFRAMGLPIKQLYGATEVPGVVAHYEGDVKWETLGKVLPTANVKISVDGEILITADKIFSGYYKDSQKTGEALVDGCWFKTGDAGFINEEEHLIFLDRMKDLMELRDGKKYAPQYIEGRLKFSNYIKDVMVTAGRDRLYVTALINIDFENVGKWAELKKINYTTYANLSQNEKVLNLIRQSIIGVNKFVPPEARVKKFINLPKEFDPDEGELTRTRKLRRTFVEKRYENLIEAMNGDKDEFVMNTEITYRDGRKDKFQTVLKIIAV